MRAMDLDVPLIRAGACHCDHHVVEPVVIEIPGAQPGSRGGARERLSYGCKRAGAVAPLGCEGEFAVEVHDVAPAKSGQVEERITVEVSQTQLSASLTAAAVVGDQWTEELGYAIGVANEVVFEPVVQHLVVIEDRELLEPIAVDVEQARV